MLIKRAYASVEAEILSPGMELVKTAGIARPVQSFIDAIIPDHEHTYVLVTALSYSEYFGPNSNTDWYGYNKHLDFNGLLHTWSDFGRDPKLDAIKAKDWAYGFPCFYAAAAYAHHKNTDPKTLGFGDVIFVYANASMRRIELVIRVFNEEARRKGHGTIIDRIERGERVDVSMGAKVPFDLCVDPSSLVRTADGWKPAGAIEPGMSILSHTGTLRRVMKRFDRESEDDERLKVCAVGVPALTVTSEHPMYVVRAAALRTCKGSANGRRRRCSPGSDGVCTFCERSLQLSPEWVPAGELQVGDYLTAPTGRLGIQAVPSAQARLLGYWIGDGHRIRQRTGKKKDGPHKLVAFGITVGHSETTHLEKVLSTITDAGAANDPGIYEAGEERKAYQIHTYDQDLASWLVTMGSDVSYTKRVHEDVFSWDADSLCELIGGWIDTDGHVSPEGHVRISTSVRGLALDGQRLLRLLGVPSGITASTMGGKEVYQFHVQRDHVRRLELVKYSTKIAEKAEVPDRAGGSQILVADGLALHPVRSVEQVEGTAPVVNFSVDGDESYVVEGVSTHNCSVCADWDRVRSSMGQYRPDSDKHPGVAVLREHAKKPIRGLARTRAEYCSCMRTQAGCVLPGGQLVYVYNDFPRFFDISFVIVGADRTSRVMWHLPARRRDRSGPVDTHTPIMHAIAGLKTASMKKLDPGTAHAAFDHRGDLSGSLSFHEDPLKMLASMGALGLVASPREFSKIVIGKAVDFDPSCAPGHDPLFAVAGCHVDGGLMDKLREMTATPTKDEIKTSSRDLAHAYAGYRLGLIKNAHSILGAGEKRASAHLGFLLDQSTVVQWISSHLTADPRSADQASLLKMSSMIRTTKDLEKIGMALDAVLGIKNTSCLWTAMTDVARTTQFL